MSPRRSRTEHKIKYLASIADQEADRIEDTILAPSYPPSAAKIADAEKVDCHGALLSITLLDSARTISTLLRGGDPSQLWADEDVIDYIRYLMRPLPSFGGPNGYRGAVFTRWDTEWNTNSPQLIFSRVFMGYNRKGKKIPMVAPQARLFNFTLEGYFDNIDDMGNLVTSGIPSNSIISHLGEIVSLPLKTGR